MSSRVKTPNSIKLNRMKVLKYLILFFALILAQREVHAQNTVFLSQGRIEYERKVNLWAQLDDIDDDAWREFEKKRTPQFKTTYFDLEFYGNKTLFKPGRENTDNNKLWQEPAEDNTVFTDLDKEQRISQKNVFEETFLVEDSTRKIQWKITDETRKIAGFECRRANALIMDSVYIVAFYTDAIITTGGPESFMGLPGMILGLAIPHSHITWFATKVYTETIKDADLIPPTKGKKVTSTTLLTTLKDRMKDWGNWGRRNIQQIMI
jgi:GLPGLI family protein